MEDAKDSKRSGSSRGKKGVTPAGSYIAFHPNKEQRELIKASTSTLSDAISLLGTFVEEGHKFYLRYSPKTEAFGATLTDGTVEWDKATSLATWHANPERAIMALFFALREVYPRFPQIVVQMELDW